MRLIAAFFLSIIVSCSNQEEYENEIKNKAKNFVEQYSNEFLKNKKLSKYTYHPRAKFTSTEESNSYRVFPGQNELNLYCFSDTCLISENFTSSTLQLKKGKYKLKTDSINEELSYNNIISKYHKFNYNPSQYFKNLRDSINKWEIFSYYKSPDNSFCKVYLDNEYYLLYSNNKAFEKHLEKDKIVSNISKNWVLVKMENKMDLG